MVEVEFLKDHGVFKKGQVMKFNKQLASDLIKYNKGSVSLKKLKKDKKVKK